METKNQIKMNLGLIVLSASIIIGCLILTENKATNQTPTTYESQESRIKLSGDIAAYEIPMGINTNSNDVTYNSKLKVGGGEKLIVHLSNGTVDEIEGESITAKYFHVSKLLAVECLSKDKKTVKFYNAPMKWGNEN